MMSFQRCPRNAGIVAFDAAGGRRCNAASAAAMLLATAGPPLLGINVLPAAVFYNQVLAIFGWGLVAVVVAERLRNRSPHVRFDSVAFLPLFATALLIVSAAVSVVRSGLPLGMALGTIGSLLAAIVCFAVGNFLFQSAQALDEAGQSPGWAKAAVMMFFVALVVAGIGNALIALQQCFVLNDAHRLTQLPRATGYLRQPNMLASQLVWAIVSLVVLVQCKRLPSALGTLCGALCLVGVALTGSRMGAGLVILLAAWGVWGRGLSPWSRRRLFCAPFFFTFVWLLLLALSKLNTEPFEAVRTNLSSNRWKMWAQSLDIIRSFPLFGVGWGEFNFAWTLTPFERQENETFTHTHNILLQWAVELGVPIALVLVALIGASIMLAWRRLPTAPSDLAVAKSGALAIFVVILFHSLLEYPLWYAHFLLPTMFAFGMALAPCRSQPDCRPGKEPTHSAPASARFTLLRASGFALAFGAALAVLDYQRVAAIYAPDMTAAQDDARRIAAGRHSVLYGQVADRLAAVITRNGERRLEPFTRPVHDMLDVRLLIAWSLALHESGDTDRARYLAQRVHEFDDPDTRAFFKACANEGVTPRPFQCEGPVKHYSFLDFRR